MVSAGLWKLGARRSTEVSRALRQLFNACLRLRMLPALGKRSIVVPILKNEHAEPSMGNVRPISLQNALTKLLSKLLATHKVHIFARHPGLHQAQEAFIKSGSVLRCSVMCLDAWEVAHVRNVGCYNIFYDVKAAFDSVQHPDLLRSLRRLALPDSFVELVADSLTGLTSCVRTAYGETEDFAVKRSVRQGDPLSPLLYICFMDPLHSGLESNPLHGAARDGFALGPAQSLASKG